MPTKQTKASDSVRQRYEALGAKETSFAEFRALDAEEARRLAQLAQDPRSRYRTGLSTMTPCGNGNFEKDPYATTGLNPDQWQGAYGSVPLAATNPFGSFTAGLFDGPIDQATSHQTWVSNGTDPYVGMPTTAQGSAGAVRIGNAVNGWGCELLSKTFAVTMANRVISFWYAVVLEDPGHPVNEQPFFWVRVTDGAGNEIAGAVDLDGLGHAKVIADAANPFFETMTTPGHERPLVFKNWSCAQIHLENHVGQTVTVEFVVADCGQGGHFGYAYVDNFCGDCKGSPDGTIAFDAASSVGCGPGNLCFAYTLPKKDTVTGSIQITLSILQNGLPVAQMYSPVLTSGERYCFDLATMPAGLDSALGGFDFVATAQFAINGVPLSPKAVGARPDGVQPGMNNDHAIACKAYRYPVKFVCGVQADCPCACSSVVPGRYATEVNIYNPTGQTVAIRKSLVPLVLAGAAAGREPGQVARRTAERMQLKANSATMEDCCRMAQTLLGAAPASPMPLTLGFLEIESPVALDVTAVYTVCGLNGEHPSIDVESIAPGAAVVSTLTGSSSGTGTSGTGTGVQFFPYIPIHKG